MYQTSHKMGGPVEVNHSRDNLLHDLLLDKWRWKSTPCHVNERSLSSDFPLSLSVPEGDPRYSYLLRWPTNEDRQN